ncbi:unnamed protein product, partial [Closterium sp. Naga37s-1]
PRHEQSSLPIAQRQHPWRRAEAALLAFAAALGNHPVLASYGNWLNVTVGMTYETTKPCVQFWKFITCDSEGRFSGINFMDNKMVGPIPNTLSTLKSLQYLDVSLNRITGPMPRGIATLTNLTRLAASHNQMTGALLPGLGNLRQLTILDLGGNRFQGPMPASWGNLKKLQTLNLQRLNLGGAVPAAWAGMVSLEHFVANAARMRGRFPSALLKLPRISDILLSNNFLWGSLPPAAKLFAPRTLTHLDVSGNYLSGAVPKVPAGRQIVF